MLCTFDQSTLLVDADIVALVDVIELSEVIELAEIVALAMDEGLLLTPDQPTDAEIFASTIS